MKLFRSDIVPIGEPKITSQGFLKVPAFVTRVGVFKYRYADGTERNELRPPDEVFKDDSINTLSEIPVTNDHPPKMINSSNAKKYQVGYTGSNVEKQDHLIKTNLTIIDQDTIEDITENGKVEVSCGYEIDMDETPGEFNGEKYDAIQRNIIYNHVAIVDRGRAGHEVRVKLDRMDAVMIKCDSTEKEDLCNQKKTTKKSEIESYSLEKKNDQEGKKEIRSSQESLHHKKSDLKQLEEKNNNDKIHGGNKMEFKFKIDGIEYSTENGHLAQAVIKRDKEFEAIKVELSTSKSSKDEVQGKLDSMTEELKKEKENKVSKEDMIKMAKEKMDLDAFALKVLGKEFKVDGLVDIDLKKEVIKKLNENAKLDDASEDYINGAFAILKENFKEEKKDGSDKLENDIRNAKLDNTDLPDVEKKKKEYMDKSENAWKIGLKEYE